MKIPNKLKIGGHTFKVNKKEIISRELGNTQFINGIIEIDKRLPQSLQESTLIHEIFHVLNSTLADGQVGHSLLDSLSEQFYQVLKDNNLLK